MVWSELDRCTWRTARSIINNSEFVVGRMYRKFIDSGQTEIRMATFLEGIPQPEREDYSLANDPGYLMPNTSTPEPYHDKPMFEKYGEVWEVKPSDSLQWWAVTRWQSDSLLPRKTLGNRLATGVP